MIRVSGTRNGKPLVMLGLDDENVRRLISDEPIQVNLHELNPHGPPTDLPDIEVVVFHITPESTALLASLPGLSEEDREDLERMWLGG